MTRTRPKEIVEAVLEAEDNLLGLGKVAFGDHRRDILLDDGKNGIELAFLFLDEQARVDGCGGLAGDDVVDALGHQDQRLELRAGFQRLQGFDAEERKIDIVDAGAEARLDEIIPESLLLVDVAEPVQKR